MKMGITINRPPRDGNMAFVRSPDLHSIELLQKGDAKAAGRAVDVDAEHRPLVSVCRLAVDRLSLSEIPDARGTSVFLPR